MSVIKEDEETETETENTEDTVNTANNKNVDESKENGKRDETETNIDNTKDTENKANNKNGDVIKEDGKEDENCDETSSDQERLSHVTVAEPVQRAECQIGGFCHPEKESENKDMEEVSGSGIISKVQSEESFVKEHRVISAVSTAVSKFPQKMETEINNGRKSRSKFVSEVSKNKSLK
jgi:hypothetical protein